MEASVVVSIIVVVLFALGVVYVLRKDKEQPKGKGGVKDPTPPTHLK